MATATIQVAYEAETSSLKATVDEINKINDIVVLGATDSAKKVKTQFDAIGKSFEAAFSSGQVKKSLDNQAKAIDNVNKSGKTLTGQLRGLKGELAALEIAGQEGTAAFNQLLIAASKLEDQIGDTRDRVKILASDTFKFDAAVGATQGLASAFELAQGASALFGTESEELQQALLKLTAATAVANSVQQLSKLVKEESAVKTAVLTAATAAYNVVVGTSTGALKLFRIALAATGVGLLVVGLVALVENFDKVKDAIFGTSESTRALAATFDDSKKAIEGATAETTKVGTAFEQAKKGVISKEAALQIYNDTLGDSFGKTTDLNVAEANYIKKKDAYIQATAARATAQALFAQSAVLAAEAATVQQNDVQTVGEKVTAFFVKASAIATGAVKGNLVQSLVAGQVANIKAEQLGKDRVKKEKEAAAVSVTALATSELDKAAAIEAGAGIISEEQQKVNDSRAQKNKAAADKALEAVKKAADDQKKARETLAALENEAFVNQLNAQSKILNDSNNKIIELEKTFAAARFDAQSAEGVQAQKDLDNAIASVRADAQKQIVEDEKKNIATILQAKLEAAKAGEGATLQQQLAALQTQLALELEAADALGKSKVDIATKYATQISSIETAIATAAVNTQINTLKALEIEQGSSLDRRIELINIEADKRKADATASIKDAKERASAIKLIEAETDAAITETRKTETDKQIALAVQYADAVVNAIGAINDLSKQQSENRIADIEASSAAELNAINTNGELERDQAKQREALQKRTAAAVAAEKTKQAKADKAFALFNIAINTAKGIISALGSTPPNPILAAAIGITGGIQLAAVAAKPIPKFERGGLVGGRLHSGGGTMIEAERDEYVVNRRQSIRHRGELNAINTSTAAFRKMIDDKYVRPALMSYSASRRGKDGVTVNASLNSKSMEKEIKGLRRDMKGRNMVVNINQQDSRYTWQ